MLQEKNEETATEGMKRLNIAETILRCGYDW